MARRLHVDPRALVELAESAQYLDDQQDGLGDELTSAVEVVFSRLRERPEAFPVVRRARGHDVRAALERRFKFRIVFVVRPRSTWVLSIARQSRRPFYWLSRLDSAAPE